MLKSPHRLGALLLLSALAGVAGCSTVMPPADAPATAAAATASVAVENAHDRLFRLFEQSDQASLRRNPLNALSRGDLRYADQFGDSITDAYYAAERAAAEADLAALAAIDRAALNTTDRIAYDTFEFTTRDTLRGLQPDLLALAVVRPLNHFYGNHTSYPAFASGSGTAPFKTVADYDNNLKRHRGFVTWIDRAIGRFREGMASGVVETRMTVGNVIEQLDTQLAQKPEDSPYYGPIGSLPVDFPADDKARLATAYRASISGELYPALTRLRDFMRDEYLGAARAGAGLLYMKGGNPLYRYLIESSTTLPLDAETVHALGLKEVARITAGMEEVRTEVGFKGTLAQFFDHLRDDPKFKPASREDLTARYYEVGKAIDAKLPAYFSTIPKSPLVIKPYEPFREKFQAGGGYDQGSADGARPGIFYFNAYDLPSRTTPGITTLYLHEGSPGHHFQISLAQENEALPSFLRYGGNTAFVEGWALYAETLGYEMGLFKDPYQRFGTLSDEMLRAMRLVVDSGIHAKGWTREQAIDYMLTHSNMGRTDVVAEVERYIVIPGQALAYKVGALTIQRLSDKARTALGDKFDIRDFHAQILMTGALPMPILERKIDEWIAEKKGGKSD